MTEKPDGVLIVDAGHAETLAMYIDLNKSLGKRKMVSFPSVRSRITGETLGLGSQEMQTNWMEWLGNRYAFGFDALALKRKNAEWHSGEARYGNELQRSLIAYAAYLCKVPNEAKIHLIVFMPPSIMKLDVGGMEYKEFMARELRRSSHISVVSSKGTQIDWDITDVAVKPEGMIGAACYILDANGLKVSSDLANATLMADLGAGTGDFIAIHNGKFNVDDIDNATVPEVGLHEQLFKPLLRDVQKAHSAFKGLTVIDMDYFAREALAQGKKVCVDFAGVTMDINDLYRYWADQYAAQIANRVLDTRFDNLREFKYLGLVGGGYVHAFKKLNELYPDKIVDKDQYPHIKAIKPWEFNVIGAFRQWIALARVKGWTD